MKNKIAAEIGKRKKWIYMALTIAWAFLIFSFSIQSGDSSSDTSSELLHLLLHFLTSLGIYNGCDLTPDKFISIERVLRTAAHFTEFFVLGLLAGRTSGSILPVNMGKIKKVVTTLAFCLSISLIDESIQLFVPGRSFQLFDISVDLMGSAIAVILMSAWLKHSSQ